MVRERLSGELKRPEGTAVPGPPTTWKGLNKPHRGDRRWATAWSPEQISRRRRVDVPDDEDMRISHEAIYQALSIEGRGALKREPVACLRGPDRILVRTAISGVSGVGQVGSFLRS